MKVHNDDGRALDAEFEVTDGFPVTLVLESRGGGRNHDYQLGLETLLGRLALLQGSIEEILLSSSKFLSRPWQESILAMPEYPYPVRLAGGADVGDLRGAISRAQQRTGREPGAKGAGNGTERIELSLTFGRRIVIDELRRALSHGVDRTLKARVGVYDKDARTYSLYFRQSDLDAAYVTIGSFVRLEIGGKEVEGQVRRSDTETWLATQGVEGWSYRRVTETLQAAGVVAPEKVTARVLAVVEDPSGATCDFEVLNRRASAVEGRPTGDIGADRPERVVTASRLFVRDPRVVAEVLRFAGGHCELCGNPAPFLRVDGQPFLEVHHVCTLAEGGADRVENAVALCPNCHRQLHYGQDRDLLGERLVTQVTRLVRSGR